MSYLEILSRTFGLAFALAFGLVVGLTFGAGCESQAHEAAVGWRGDGALPAGDPSLDDGDAPVDVTDDDDDDVEGVDDGADDDADDGADDGAEDTDDDGDGLADRLEEQLARNYLPFLSNHPNDECLRSGIVFRARPHPLDAMFVHVIYSRLYEYDCGFTRHAGDNEVFAITVDPTRTAPAGIVAMRAVSHQNTICERDTTCGACEGLRPCDTTTRNGTLGGTAGWPVVYASKDKHASAVDVHEGCSLDASCLDVCALADAPALVALVNAGEPGRPLVDDLSDPAQGGFITDENGWSEPSELHYDPWGGAAFGEAGVVAEDLVDPAFDTPVCRPVSGVDDPTDGPPGDDVDVEPFVAAADFVTEARLCDIPLSADDVVDPVNAACALEVRNVPADAVTPLAWGATLRVVAGATADALLRVYASHLCTRPQFPSDDPRAVQGAEIRADAARAGRPAIQVVGGDLNTWTCNPANSDCTSSPDAEEVIVDFLNDGWTDGTHGYNGIS